MLNWLLLAGMAWGVDSKAQETGADLRAYLFPSNLTEMVFRRDLPNEDSRFYRVCREGGKIFVKSCEMEEELSQRELDPRTQICGRAENYVWASRLENDSCLYIASFDPPTNAECKNTFNIAHNSFKSITGMGLKAFALGLPLPPEPFTYAVSNNFLYCTNAAIHRTQISRVTFYTSNSATYFQALSTNFGPSFTNVLETRGTVDPTHHVLKSMTGRMIQPEVNEPFGLEVLSFKEHSRFDPDFFRPEYHICGLFSTYLYASNNTYRQVDCHKMPKLEIFHGRLWRASTLRNLKWQAPLAVAVVTGLALLRYRKQKKRLLISKPI